MYYNEILKQKNKEKDTDFIERVQEFLNKNINNAYTKLINIQWFTDDDSYYPYSCIITYFKELS